MLQNAHLATLANGTRVSVWQGDIAASTTDAVVNAANASSFTRLDGGVSGALRNACDPEIAAAIDAPKFRFGAGGERCTAPEPLEVGQVRFQDTFGRLRGAGVRWIIHALGPNWQDADVSEPDAMFAEMAPRIRDTVTAAIHSATLLGARSVTIPALSGGIFTHKPFDDDSRALHEAEQRTARRELVAAIFAWGERCSAAERSATRIDEIVIVTLPATGRLRRQAEAEARMLEDAIAEHLQAAGGDGTKMPRGDESKRAAVEGGGNCTLTAASPSTRTQ